MTDLSLAAQAVLNASNLLPGKDSYLILAAALRAVVVDRNKQIDIPFSTINQWEEIKGKTLSYWTAAQWGHTKAMNEIFAIVYELENIE